MSFKEGDLIKVNGETGQWYAEVVGENEDNQLEVFYISRGSINKWVWQYDEDWEVVSKHSVLEHIPLDKKKAVGCYKQLGFRPLTENTFVKLDDKIPDNILVPIGDFDEEEGSDGSLEDFIVPDEEGEAFAPADPSISFVQETHDLVHRYNNWEPKNKSEKKLKGFVDRLSHKYKLQDDERQFVEGKSLDYDHPPLKKRKSNE